MAEWRTQWHIGTGGATDPNMPMGFVQIGPMTNDEGDNAVRSSSACQTANYGYAPNKAYERFHVHRFRPGEPSGDEMRRGLHPYLQQTGRSPARARGPSDDLFREGRVLWAEDRLGVDPRPLTVKYDTIGTEGEGIKLRGGYGFEVSSTATDATGKVGT